jgi:hypothetical protein
MDAFTRTTPTLDYGTPAGPGTQAFADYKEEQALLRLAASKCRYCKSARTRSGDPKRWCSKHAQRSWLNYACSPVSETYWSS